MEDFIDFYDPETLQSAVCLPQFEERTLEEQAEFKKRCYYKVRLQSSSYLHTVWLNPS